VQVLEDAGDSPGYAGIYSYLSTDQVRFYTATTQRRPTADARGSDQTPIPLEEVPPLVLSEIFRDVDLFVGVCSVGNDQTWSDGGADGPLQTYWRNYSFGDLSATAKTRKELLESLLPKLKIGPKCRLVDKYLVVQGSRRVYKIHLGSGNILMEPNDQYLCIVPDSRNKSVGEKVWLPFEGDSMFSIILSKAFMLANDNAIKDASVNSQIGDVR
jgi:hypothetical protein